jgi:hypothetical protein
MGLFLNPTKCEWSWVDPECSDPCPFSDQISMVPTREVQMLGVPLGSPKLVADFVERKLFSKLDTVVERL